MSQLKGYQNEEYITHENINQEIVNKKHKLSVKKFKNEKSA